MVPYIWNPMGISIHCGLSRYGYCWCYRNVVFQKVISLIILEGWFILHFTPPPFLSDQPFICLTNTLSHTSPFLLNKIYSYLVCKSDNMNRKHSTDLSDFILYPTKGHNVFPSLHPFVRSSAGPASA